MKNFIIIIAAAYFTTLCQEKHIESSIDVIAEKYVRLALSIGQYDDSFVDAYFGPSKWKPSGEILDVLPSDDFIQQTSGLLSECDELKNMELSDSEKYRLEWLIKQLIAVKTKVEMMAGIMYDFDKEAQMLYDVKPPKYSIMYFDSLHNKLDSILPGNGILSERYLNYSKQFIIPLEKLDTIFKVAILEARKRTIKYIQMPENENFKLEYVNDKSWGAYNYYLGNGQSSIHINTDIRFTIDRVIDLACHEGYPGHHVFMTLLDQIFYKEKGWVEYSIYPLFSPLSLISEGCANFGIEVAFPSEERVKYEQEVLFPLANLDQSKVIQYYVIQDLKKQLKFANNEVARQYLNGEISRDEAAKWIEKYLLFDHETALRRTRFFDEYRSYIINYNLGEKLVSNYIITSGGTSEVPDKRWSLFNEMLSYPPIPNSLEN